MKRYVDDCFARIPTDYVERFLLYINSINGNLQFTNDIEDNGTLCYLDIKILRQEAGAFKFAIYRKALNTGRLLDYDRYAPGIQKRNVIKSLVQRALKNCSDTEQSSELDFITETLKKNDLSRGKLRNLSVKRTTAILFLNNNKIRNISLLLILKELQKEYKKYLNLSTSTLAINLLIL